MENTVNDCRVMMTCKDKSVFGGKEVAAGNLERAFHHNPPQPLARPALALARMQ